MKPKKVGILTYHDINNYGAQLQAASLQRFVESLGFDAELINYCPWRSRVRHLMVFVRLSIRMKLKVFKFEFLRRRKFLKSIRRLAKVSNENIYTQAGVGRYSYSKYDYLICGSDELWNFQNYLGYQRPYVLDFSVSNNVKKISYAASMGSCEPGAALRNQMESSLKQFSTVMVRDPHTKKFIESLNDVNSPTRVVDPTLLWDFTPVPPKIRPPYVLLTGALCELPNIVSLAKEFAKRKGLEILCIGVKPLGLEDRVVQATPEEWVGYIAAAECHITSLFHGSIFSMKHKTPFCVVVPDDKKQKISSLLEMLCQENRALNVDCSFENLELAILTEFSEKFGEAKSREILKSKQKLASALGLLYD